MELTKFVRYTRGSFSFILLSDWCKENRSLYRGRHYIEFRFSRGSTVVHI